jgi:hypothetical protein
MYEMQAGDRPSHIGIPDVHVSQSNFRRTYSDLGNTGRRQSRPGSMRRSVLSRTR